jgi:hypothetical protein
MALGTYHKVGCRKKHLSGRLRSNSEILDLTESDRVARKKYPGQRCSLLLLAIIEKVKRFMTLTNGSNALNIFSSKTEARYKIS